MIDAGTVYSALVLDSSKYETNMKNAQKQMQDFSQKMQDVGKKMEKVGKEWSKKVTAPIVGVGAFASKSAIDFESAFAGVRKTVDVTEAKFAELSKGIRDMSKEIPASAVAIAGVAEAAGQLGIEADNILSFSRVMIDLGEATNLSADEAATSLARLANITGMSQSDFDRLGSVIVDLGNNLATTEAEIVAMGLRLAGAGNQIGLSEAQTMSFAGALSSVGIEAEAGGSAFSKLMINMQLASETGGNANDIIKRTGMSLRDLEMFSDADGKSFKELAQSLGLTSTELKGYMSTAKDLEAFAKVTGKSGQEFAMSFRDDATGAIIEFIGGLATAEERGMSAIAVLDDMGITEVRLRDALLRAAGANDVFKESLEIGNKAWEENTALTKEAEERYKTTASQLQITRNHLQDAGITIGEILIPHLITLAEKITEVVTWFSKLGTGTQETIVRIAGLAAAIGPVVLIGKNIIGLFGAVAGVFSTVSGALAVVTTGAAATTPAVGALASAFTVLTGPLGLVVAGVAGLTAVGVSLYKHLKQDAIPAVDLFGDQVSDTTQKAVGGYLELDKKATEALKSFAFGQQEITEKMAGDLIGTYSQMNNQIMESMDKRQMEEVEQLRGLFATTTSMTEEEQVEALARLEAHQSVEKNSVELGQKQIEEILRTAAEEKRAITEEEHQKISLIQDSMKQDAIRIMSESEAEQKAILEGLRTEAEKITARQAADVAKNAIKQRDDIVKEAEKQYKDTIAAIIRQRDETGAITAQQAEEMIRNAQKQRDETIGAAEETHEKIVAEAQAQAGEHANLVDWETGEIKTKWQAMVSNVKEKAHEMKENAIKEFEELKISAVRLIKEKKEDIINKWTELKEDAYKWAFNMMDMFKKGITDKITAITDAVKGVGTKIANFLGFASPTKEGPLSDSDKWMPNMMKMLQEGIEKNTGNVSEASEDLAKQIGGSLGSVDTYASNTVSGIEKQFQLWTLQNNLVKDSAEYLSEQLEVQRQKHEVLNGQIRATEMAISKISEGYGEGSSQALEYRNKLLDLMIAQEGLKKSVDETTAAIERQSKVALSGQSSSDITSRYMADYINRTGNVSVAFGQAPKFHDGGWVGAIKGKRFDELMALLQTGEFVVSKKMVDNYERMASPVVESRGEDKKRGDIHQHITINSPEPLTPSEVARRTLQSSRQLAMEWGF